MRFSAAAPVGAKCRQMQMTEMSFWTVSNYVRKHFCQADAAVQRKYRPSSYEIFRKFNISVYILLEKCYS